MSSPVKRSLEAKIIVVLGLVLTVLLAISSAVDIWFESRDTYHVVFRELEVLANTIQKSLIKDMREGRGSDVQEILEMVGTEKGIIAVRIFDEDGKILKSTERSDIGRSMPATTLQSFKAGVRDFVSEPGGYKVFHIIHPIANAPPCYGCHGKDREINGVLSLEYSLQPVQEHMHRHWARMVALLMVTIVVTGMAIYLLMKRLISVPIKDMKAAMADAEGGNLDIALPVSSDDEIGSLQQSFNNMLSKIKGLNEKTLLQQRDIVKKEQELELQQFLAEQNRVLESANREIVEKNRYYMEMLSFISHELKNPLLVLKGYSGLLLKEDLGDLADPQREALVAMERNVVALQEMIANYLDLSRIERGELRPEKRRIELVEDVIKPVMDEHAEILEKSSMTLRIEGAKSPVRLDADPALVKSVIGNLVTNAVKYGLAGSDVLVEVEPAGDRVRISVFNEGPGIPSEDLERIFERFTRLDNEAARMQKGSGLGLYIVKQIVEMHGGKVWAESKEGSWAKITFTLPTAGWGEGGNA